MGISCSSDEYNRRADATFSSLANTVRVVDCSGCYREILEAFPHCVSFVISLLCSFAFIFVNLLPVNSLGRVVVYLTARGHADQSLETSGPLIHPSEYFTFKLQNEKEKQVKKSEKRKRVETPAKTKLTDSQKIAAKLGRASFLSVLHFF